MSSIQWRKARWCGGNGLGVNRGKLVRRLLFSVRKVFWVLWPPLLDSPRFTIEIFDRECHSTSFLKIPARSKGPSIPAESLLNTCWTPANFRYITHNYVKFEMHAVPKCEMQRQKCNHCKRNKVMGKQESCKSADRKQVIMFTALVTFDEIFRPIFYFNLVIYISFTVILRLIKKLT